MLNTMVVFTFSLLDRKYPFWLNLVEIRYLDKFEFAEFDGDFKFFFFKSKYYFLGIFGPKILYFRLTLVRNIFN